MPADSTARARSAKYAGTAGGVRVPAEAAKRFKRDGTKRKRCRRRGGRARLTAFAFAAGKSAEGDRAGVESASGTRQARDGCDSQTRSEAGPTLQQNAAEAGRA